MKKLLAGLVMTFLACVPAALAQDQLWINQGQIIVPSTNVPYAPQIDAISMVNDRGATLSISGTSLFSTSDTLNYTNLGTMTGYPGFDFQTYPSGLGVPRMAANFANLASGPSGGQMNVLGTLYYGGIGGFFFGNLSGNAKLLVRATNIVNSGNINMAASALLSLVGKNVNLSRGGLTMDNTGNQGLFTAGILDGYWSAETDTNAFNPVNTFGGIFPRSPFHWVTTRDYFTMGQVIFGQDAYVNDSGVVGSNRFVQAVFLYNADTNFINTVYFSPFEIAVEWKWVTQDWPATTLTTNYFFVTDNFGEVTNIGLRVNGYVNPQAFFPRPTFIPENYLFVQGIPYQLYNNVPAATPGMLPNVFDDLAVTNQYTAYEALFTAGTALPTDVVGGAYSNMPGRIEITAETSLDLYRSRISTLNYLRLEATNHFKGSQNAVIKTPYADYFLRSTNGSMIISNLVAPFIAHPNGPCDLYSGRWTNVVDGITNSYHVLVVDSRLTPLNYPQIANMHLEVTNTSGTAQNLEIHDHLNVTTSLQLKTESLTIGMNDSTSYFPFGEVNVLGGDVVWSTATPGLQYLTNWGSIGIANAVYFGGSRSQPPYNGQPDIPYQAFVNHGGVTNQGALIWSKYFANDGVFDAGSGSIVLRECLQAVLGGGVLYAPLGQVSLFADSLVASNSVIIAGGPLELSATNLLTDGGGIFSANVWNTTGGFSLLNKPATGDLLATTVYNTAPDYQESVNYWAGEDRGKSTSGFVNNAALGSVVLDGGVDSGFMFAGTDSANAMYVDVLELRGSITNRDSSGNFTGLNIQPNMTIYFADAIANGSSIAEKLDGRNGGRLVWVSGYAGNYSGTDLLYPDGQVYHFNRALVQSCNLDSDGDGIPNCSDSTPLFVPGVVHLSIAITNQPPGARVLSWPSLANSTNYLYYKDNPNSSIWRLLTNFVSGPDNGRAAVVDTATTSTRYYRARVDGGQP